MKNEFAFLYPTPRAVRLGNGFLDIRSLCFPLEIVKKYAFLFAHFSVRNRNRGLEILCQERPALAAEEYTLECGPGGIVLSASSGRGQFYAVSTLLQILSFYEGTGHLPAFSLRDAPQIPFRGFMLPGGKGSEPDAAGLHHLLLKMALLKFNHIALPASILSRSPGAAADAAKALIALARSTGMEIIWLDDDPQALFTFGRDPGGGGSAGGGQGFYDPVRGGEQRRPAEWLEFFLVQQRGRKALGKRTAVWSDNFLRHPEWIRKIPRDVLVLHRDPGTEAPGFFRTVLPLFKKHHIPQALCPAGCSRDRFLPDARAALDRVGAACAAAGTEKLAGVMLAGGEDDRCACLPEGSVMLHFQAGCLLWSGRPPAPGAFSRWVLGHDEPDLFRVYSFLAQAEHRLPYSHCRYLFEDPLNAPFSRQGDPREVVAHFHKAAQYLKKREITRNELTDFIHFVGRLYEYVAVKVDFSSRLGPLLGEKDGERGIRGQAVRLELGSRELKDSYSELWRRHFRAGDLPPIARGFDFLCARFAFLGQAVASPASREKLRAEMISYPPLALPAASIDGGFWQP